MELTKEVGNILNGMKMKQTQHIWDAAKAVLRRKFIALHVILQ